MTRTDSCIVGKPAPAFAVEAVTHRLETINLGTDDFRGHWSMLIFYPRDFSFVCPTELTGFSAEMDQFEKLDCKILGISIDSVDTHIDWLKTPEEEGGVQGLRFPLASDPDGELCRRFGVWRDVDELPNRGLFLIDPSGTLRYAVTHDLSVGRSTDDVLRALNALKTGGLCPSNWKRADGVLDVSAMLKPGRVLGNYRIERELGRGGFGQVWEAEDLRLQRKVALKIIADQGEEAEQSLLKEARLAAGINHANVCTIYSADSIDTLPVIAMEFVESGTLADAIDKGIAQHEFRSLAHDITSGLAAAHRGKIVHGDLKPANILLGSLGNPVIADFGLARALGQSEARTMQNGESPSPNLGQPTSESNVFESLMLEETVVLEHGAGQSKKLESGDSSHGLITGTPAYMSPEQAFGESLDEASDIFSLGLIFAHMLLGQSLFGDLPVLEIIRSLRQDEFVDSLANKLPVSYQEVFADMLAVTPSDRPGAKEVCRRLMAFSG